MKLKDLIKKAGFWAAVSGIVVIVLQMFGVKAPLPYVNEILSGVCAVLVMLGLMSAADKSRIDEELEKKAKNDEKSENNIIIDDKSGFPAKIDKNCDNPPENDGKCEKSTKTDKYE